MEQKKVKINMGSIVKGVIIVLVVALALLGLRPPSIAMNNNGFKIGGLYGKLYDWDKIVSVELLNQMPKIGVRTNGMDLGSTKRGYFNLDNYGSSTLYVNETHHAFITFKYLNRQVFVSFDDTEKANDLYESMLKFIE